MKNTLSDGMKNIERLLWKQFQYEMNSRGQIHLAYSSHSWFVTISSNTTQKGINDIVARINSKVVINKDIKSHQLDSNTIMIGSVATPEDAIKFHEAVVVKEGEKIIEAQKKVLELKQNWSKSLKALVDAKKDLEINPETVEFVKTINETM
jgi:hypothetical protein